MRVSDVRVLTDSPHHLLGLDPEGAVRAAQAHPRLLGDSDEEEWEMHSSGDKLYTLGLWKLPFEGWGVDGPISAGRGKVESLSAAALG